MNESESDSARNGWASRLVKEISSMREAFIAAVSSSEALSILEECKHCAYVKSADGDVIMGNANYERTFSGQLAGGRNAAGFLDETIATVARHSDSLIVAGCQSVVFEHNGLDGNGNQVLMHSAKQSLLGCNQPRAAIIGITELQPAPCEDSTRLFKLSQYWEVFKSLPARDRAIAVALCRGERSKTLSVDHSVTEKTIDNRRASVLQVLQLENLMDLARLLTRLQDNGFCDLGL